MTDYEKELSRPDELRLAKAAGHGRWAPDGVGRYSFYRRKGHGPADALAYALAWCRNAAEQKSRRKGHQTGCV
jgi:hypothetical protein